MSGGRLSWLKQLLPVSRQEQALAAKLADIQARLATITGVVRDLSSAEDAHAHAIRKAARASRGAMTENAAADPVQDVMISHAANALARSMAAAKTLDRVTEALEQLASLLREG